MPVLGSVFLLMVGSGSVVVAVADVEDWRVYGCELLASLPWAIGGGLMLLHGLRPLRDLGDSKGPAGF